MYLENSVNRNQVAHTDDEIFEQYPTWEEFKAAKFSSLNADDYFGGEGDTGGRNYAQCAKYGIGREPMAKMLEGTETRSAIEEALRNLPMTARRKRGIEQQIEEARQEAEKLRAEADRIEAEREAERQKARVEELAKQAELDRIAAAKRQAEAATKAALYEFLESVKGAPRVNFYSP